jgi:hypothetical protein
MPRHSATLDGAKSRRVCTLDAERVLDAASRGSLLDPSTKCEHLLVLRVELALPFHHRSPFLRVAEVGQFEHRPRVRLRLYPHPPQGLVLQGCALLRVGQREQKAAPTEPRCGSLDYF